MYKRQALEIKGKTNLPVVAVTFDPHPKSLIQPSDGYNTLLTPVHEKKALFEAMGVDSVSYTHLDVYKRQQKSLAGRNLRG